MAACPSPITTENFPEAWRCIARKRYWSKKKCAIRSACVPVSQLLYFFAFVILAFGAACSMTPSYIRSYIGQLPQLVSLWEKFAAVLFASAQTEVQRILCCAGFLILIPFVASLPIGLAILLFYHPRTAKPIGDPARDSRELWVMAKHAQVYAQRKEGTMANMCGLFAGLLILLAVFGLVLYMMKDPVTHAQIQNNAAGVAWIMFLYAAGAFAAYKLLNLPLFLLLKLMHYCRVPDSILADAEAYHTQLTAAIPNETNGDA